ncbi:class I SAM-dependent DNA methyltransferase [Pedobacter jamesrossensis]|uniref:Class I SAM-dependent DNA methyltransferase n=1 Tax=Pedobacter jamesrossensis TaxID=1908238 RepID=A0ABV8NGY7_9SPHI
MEKVFNAYSSYYNLLYKDKDYASEADYIADLIKQYKPEAKTLIEFGSGTGKHALLFCQKGFIVKGIEPSEEMIKIAQQNKHANLSFANTSIEGLNIEERFEVASALFHVVSYLNYNNELINSFKNIHKHLNENGLFIFDLWYTPAVLSQIPEKRIKTTEDEHIKVIRNATPVNHWN